MLKKTISMFLVFTMVYVGGAMTALAATSAEKDAARAAKVKAAVAKLGVGTDTRVSLKLKDKTKLEGYIAEAGEESFVVADLKTNAATTVTYPAVAKMSGKNLSTGAWVTIGVVAAIGTVLLILLLIRLDNEGGL
ncbi:MAG: hypothetical protein KA368_21875 [Acidobacteria bacterium]|nr:hypothetical protein [Acidobacteriota bacterium]